jgi:CysZ protein
MFASIGRALSLIFDPALIGVVVKALLLTIVLFLVLLVGLEYALHLLPTLGVPWVNRVLEILAPIFLLMGFFVLGGPVAALFGSLYLDRIANAVEKRWYATDARAPGTSLGTGLGAGFRLAGLVLLADLLLLPSDVLAPGFGEIATIVVNGFLLGREYFELAALRHVSLKAADALRRRNSGSVFVAGLILSVLTFVPLVNLFAPLFGAALMVHLYKRMAQETPR